MVYFAFSWHIDIILVQVGIPVTAEILTLATLESSRL